MKKETFIFHNLSTVQVSIWFIVSSALIIVNYGFFKIYLEDYLRIIKFPQGLIITLVFFSMGIFVFKKLFFKKTIEFIIKDNILKIITEEKQTFEVSLDNFKCIRTLDPNNPKRASVQIELFFKDKKLSFFSQIASQEQFVLQRLCNLLQKEYDFTVSEVPFSIWTHNFQKIKYLEYTNPHYHE